MRAPATANFRIEIAMAGYTISNAFFAPAMLQDVAGLSRSEYAYTTYDGRFYVQRDSNWGVTWNSTPLTTNYVFAGPYTAFYSEFNGTNIAFGIVVNESTRYAAYTGAATYVTPSHYGILESSSKSLFFLGYREVALP